MVSGRGPSSRRLPASTKGTPALHAFVEDAGAQTAALDGLAHGAGAVNGVDGAHVVAVPVLVLAAIGEAHAERGAEQRGFDVVDAQGVAAEQGLHPAIADQRGEPRHPAGVDHHRAGHHHHLQLLPGGLADQRGGLAHGGLHLALRGDAVGHEGERQAVALLRFGHHAHAAQAHHDRIARAQIAHAPAAGAAIADHDEGVHALIFDFDPLLLEADVGPVVGGGVEILGSAAVALGGAQKRIAALDGRAAQFKQSFEEAREGGIVGSLHLQTQVGGFAVGASDAELFHFEAAVMLHDLVEDALHDVGIDQVAFGFDHFLKWHRSYYCSGGGAR